MSTYTLWFMPGDAVTLIWNGDLEKLSQEDREFVETLLSVFGAKVPDLDAEPGEALQVQDGGGEA